MKVVMPIAGLGSRFTKVGIETPKPLISILGKHMAEWAADSLPFVSRDDFIFIVRQEHVDQYKIDEELKRIFSPKVTILVINYVTEGAACTVLLAKEHINNDEQLIVTDCDHYFLNEKYQEMIEREDVDGLIPVFECDGNPKWSFTKVDENWKAEEVAEKKAISKYANIGAYYFRKGKDFVAAAEEMIAKDARVNGEFYVAPVFQQLIENGKAIYAALSEEVWGLGTPEDVEKFEKYHN